MLCWQAGKQITQLSDGTFVIVYQIAGTVLFLQYDQLGNTNRAEGTLVTPNFAAGTVLEIQAVEDNKLVLAYAATNNTVQVQSYSILDGAGATTTDISNELTVTDFDANNVAPSISGTTIDDLAVHALLHAG